jgi:HAD superfamily hydrolase (TIGR01490 family)
MSIAFFDLDKTLIAENSAKLWLKALWSNRDINLPHMIHASYWLAKYHLGFTKMDEVIEKGLSLIAGESSLDILNKTRDFYQTTIKNLYRPGAIAALKAHQELGHQVSLLTSSFDGLSLLVQRDLGLDFCLCTRLEVDAQGLYTGKTLGPPCFGKNKVFFAEQLCDQLKISLSQCTFYTDSASDLPLLNLVGRAVAVNPDPHLRARAQMKRWEIVDWGKPAWAKSLNK